MEHLPHGGYSEFVTKEDLESQTALLRSDLESRTALLRSDLESRTALLRSEMQALGTQLRLEMEIMGQTLRKELADAARRQTVTLFALISAVNGMFFFLLSAGG